MNREQVRGHLLSLPEAREDYPFGPDVTVMKVEGRMFATLAQADGLWRMNLKCDPDEALILRDIFTAVLPFRYSIIATSKMLLFPPFDLHRL